MNYYTKFIKVPPWTIIRNSIKYNHDILYATLKKFHLGLYAKVHWAPRRDVPLGKPVMFHVTLCEVLRYVPQCKRTKHRFTFVYFFINLIPIVSIVRMTISVSKSKILIQSNRVNFVYFIFVIKISRVGSMYNKYLPISTKIVPT